MAAAGGDDCCFGLLTLVLLFANSRRIVCGRSGSKRTPCCRSCFADSAPARDEKVTKPTGDEVFPFLEVTLRSEPSYPWRAYVCQARASPVASPHLVCSEQKVQLARLGVHWESTHEQRAHLSIDRQPQSRRLSLQILDRKGINLPLFPSLHFTSLRLQLDSCSCLPCIFRFVDAASAAIETRP